MEHISTASSSLRLGDKQYVLNINESRLTAEPPSAQIDVTDPQNGQSWSITLNAELLHSLANDDLPRRFVAFFKIVKIALLLEKETTTFSYNFGTDAEKQHGIRGKQEAVSGDSLYIMISSTPYEDPIVFTLVLPQVSPPRTQFEGNIPAGAMAMIAGIRRSNEVLVMENEAISAPFHDSQIVDKPQQQQLNTWYGTPQQKWKLLYRGSEHGFTAKSFHQHCDNKGPTMVIVKSVQNYIFGGYASISWSSPQPLWSAAAGSFVYTLVNPSGITAKFDITANQGYALNFDSGYGPVFGYGHDIAIFNCCHQNAISRSTLGGSYSGSGAQKHLLVGQQFFQVAEYEVFGLA